MFAVVFIDLDDFKDVNDTHGHEAGDAVLKKLAQTLTGMTRENDIVARLGGDEFVGLFDVQHETDVDIIKKKLFASILKDIHCPTYNVTIHYSLGVSVYPTDGTSIDTLLQKADQAMYLEKEKNKAARRKNS